MHVRNEIFRKDDELGERMELQREAGVCVSASRYMTFGGENMTGIILIPSRSAGMMLVLLRLFNVAPRRENGHKYSGQEPSG